MLTHTQLNSWAVYNWEKDAGITQKDFILSVTKGLLLESDPDCPIFFDADDASPDLLSPAAKETPPAGRFFCRKPAEASIAKSKQYK